MQCLMGGWWGEYSFRCQPVDYSENPTAIRVSSPRISFSLSDSAGCSDDDDDDKITATVPDPCIIYPTLLIEMKIYYSPDVYICI